MCVCECVCDIWVNIFIMSNYIKSCIYYHHFVLVKRLRPRKICVQSQKWLSWIVVLTLIGFLFPLLLGRRYSKFGHLQIKCRELITWWDCSLAQISPFAIPLGSILCYQGIISLILKQFSALSYYNTNNLTRVFQPSCFVKTKMQGSLIDSLETRIKCGEIKKINK